MDGDPAKELIQWEESFGIFTDDALTSPVEDGGAPLTYENNKFTIEINEENPEKGAYIVKNIFKNSQFMSNMVTYMNKGGEYYANYEDGKLTIFKSNANISSYAFANDVVLTYDSSLKKFTSGAIELGYTTGGPSKQNYMYIGNYEAVHYVAPDPGAGDSPLSAFVGTWSESFTNNYFMGSGTYSNDQTVTVSVDGDKLLFENMIQINSWGTLYSGSYYGTLSADGKTITLEDVNPSSGHGTFGPLSYQPETTIVLTVGTGTLTCASTYSGNIVNYQLFNQQ